MTNKIDDNIPSGVINIENIKNYEDITTDAITSIEEEDLIQLQNFLSSDNITKMRTLNSNDFQEIESPVKGMIHFKTF